MYFPEVEQPASSLLHKPCHLSKTSAPPPLIPSLPYPVFAYSAKCLPIFNRTPFALHYRSFFAWHNTYIVVIGGVQVRAVLSKTFGIITYVQSLASSSHPTISCVVLDYCAQIENYPQTTAILPTCVKKRTAARNVECDSSHKTFLVSPFLPFLYFFLFFFTFQDISYIHGLLAGSSFLYIRLELSLSQHFPC